MSPRAERIAFLRQLLLDLQARLDNWPETWKHRHAMRKRARRNLDIVEDILRNLGAALIEGTPQ
ncbi:MAG TPA: hypothetical protein VGE36_04560 [Roseateles sp.]